MTCPALHLRAESRQIPIDDQDYPFSLLPLRTLGKMLGMEAELSLLDAARGMDKKALIAIFDRYAPELYNYALRLCGDPLQADHVVGDVFTKFLERLVAGKGPRTNLRSYLYKMTYHLIILMGHGFPSAKCRSNWQTSNETTDITQWSPAWKTKY